MRSALARLLRYLVRVVPNLLGSGVRIRVVRNVRVVGSGVRVVRVVGRVGPELPVHDLE